MHSQFFTDGIYVADRNAQCLGTAVHGRVDYAGKDVSEYFYSTYDELKQDSPYMSIYKI